MIGKIGFNCAPFQKSLVNKNLDSRNVSFGIKKHTEPILDPENEQVQFTTQPPGGTYLVEGTLDKLSPGKTPDQKKQDDRNNISPSQANLEGAEEDLQDYQTLVGNCEV